MTRITQSGPGIPGPASDDRRGSGSSFAPARGRRPTRSQRSCLRKATRVSARSLRRVGGSRARGLAFIHTRPIPRCGSASGSNRSHRNDRRLACESPRVVSPDRAHESKPSVSRAWVSALGCQLGSANSWFDGAVCAAGRSLPEMSLAFALMAAINGSTGSRATRSHGL